MSQDVRLYSLSLMIVLMLWVAPVHADYGLDSTCPALAVPIVLQDDNGWYSGSDEDGDWMDLRDLYPASGTNANVTEYADGENGFGWGCELSVGSGSYYDGANHLWVLDDNLTCDFNGGAGGDFRAGYDY